MTRLRPALFAILAAAIAPVPASADDPIPAMGVSGKVCVGYLYGRADDLNFDIYTHLCHAFLTADADGTIHLPRGTTGRELTAEAHRHGVAVLISLGGWGWDDQFAAIASDETIKPKYIDSVMEYVDSCDYDGIDLDWEFPDSAPEIAGFEALCREFRDRLDARAQDVGRPMRLTMAASSNPGTLKWLDPAKSLATLDWINVMTYDYTGPWTDTAGHNAPLFPTKRVRGAAVSASDSIRFLIKEQGFPADRLTLGLPLYGRASVAPEPFAAKVKDTRIQTPRGDYTNLHRLLTDEGWTRRDDPEIGVPWLIAPKENIIIGYDDPESIARKTTWALELGLRGVFFWQVAGDRLPDGSNPLQEAARSALDAAK